MADLNAETIEKILQLGRATYIQDHFGDDGDDILILPANMKVEDVSRFMAPKRIQATALFSDTGSFSAYVNRFKTAATILMQSQATGESDSQFVAHLDYHEAAPELTPAWRRHKAIFQPQETPEWREWKAMDREAKSQMDFALWLEDHYELLTNPGGADLLELIKSLEGRQDVRFNSAVRLQTGTHRLYYDEDVQLRGQATPTSKAGELELPTTVQAALKPFEGMPPVTLTARLKFSIEGRKLSLRLETLRMERTVTDALEQMALEIQDLTGLPAWNGSV